MVGSCWPVAARRQRGEGASCANQLQVHSGAVRQLVSLSVCVSGWKILAAVVVITSGLGGKLVVEIVTSLNYITKTLVVVEGTRGYKREPSGVDVEVEVEADLRIENSDLDLYGKQ